MNTLIKKIVDDIVSQYKQDKNVLSIMLFGSVARNKFDKYSDVDIYILLKKKGRYSRFNFVRDNIRVDIIFNTIKEAKTYLKGDTYNIRRNTSHMLTHGQILSQRSNDLKNIQRIARKNLTLRTRYSKNEVLMHKYSIDDFWGEVQRDVEKNDIIAFGLDSQLLLNNVIELFLKLKGGFLGQSNEMSMVFKRLDRTFSRKVESFYAARDLKTKQRALGGLVGYIYKQSNGGLPRKWALKD